MCVALRKGRSHLPAGALFADHHPGNRSIVTDEVIRMVSSVGASPGPTGIRQQLKMPNLRKVEAN